MVKPALIVCCLNVFCFNFCTHTRIVVKKTLSIAEINDFLNNDGNQLLEAPCVIIIYQ